MADPDPARPLDDIRVLDVGTRIGAPFQATLLAEFGADVIKVEKPGSGDFMREIGPFKDDYSLFWATEGRGKRSITLDLRRDEGQELFLRLAAQVDVVVENFRPGTLEGWGLGYDVLSDRNRHLILSRTSVYGQDGPYRDRPGLDRMGIGLGGLLYLTGEPGRPPMRPGVVVSDYLTGVFGAYGIMLALRERDRSGRGQVVDGALYESILRILECVPAAFDQLGIVRERQGNRLVDSAPLDNFACGDGEYVCVVAASDALFPRLAHAIGRSDLLDEDRYATLGGRAAHGDELNAIVSDWCSRRSSGEVVELLVAADVPVARAASVADIFADPQVAARDALVTVPDPVLGDVMQQAVTPRLGRTPGRVERGAPRLGEHNSEIYAEYLGLDATDLERLEADGVI